MAAPMTRLVLSGPLARVMVELATAGASRPGMTVKEWINNTRRAGIPLAGITRRKAQQGG